jgi:hypothetical protein
MTISRIKASSNVNGLYPGNFTNTATGSGSGYKYVSFTASGTLTVDVPGLFQILVLGAGGGGGGYGEGAGGGSGGLLQITRVLWVREVVVVLLHMVEQTAESPAGLARITR